MAVGASQSRPWGPLLQRGLDTAADLSELVAAKISAAADPRARLLRRRRRALRWGLIFAVGCVFWAVVTVVLAAWGWFALLLQITGFIAAAEAIPAIVARFANCPERAPSRSTTCSQMAPSSAYRAARRSGSNAKVVCCA